MAADYAHQADQAHARKLERAAQMMRGWREEDDSQQDTAHYVCRDIGYGVEEGEVYLPAADAPDWTGKRPYRRVGDGVTLYLFDDEVQAS